MATAIWIIAIVEIIRMIQNTIQLMAIGMERKQRDKQMDVATSEFVKSMKRTDKEYIDDLAKKLNEIKKEKE